MMRWALSLLLLALPSIAGAQVVGGGGLQVTGNQTAGLCPIATSTVNLATWAACTSGDVVDLTAGTGIALSPSPITSTGTISIGPTVLTAAANPASAGLCAESVGSGSNATSWAACGGGGGSVSVTAGNAGIVVSPSPLTGTGTVSLGAPTASTLGGIESAAAVTNEWINSISTAGVPALSQPAFSNLSGSATLAQLPSQTANSVLGATATGAPSDLAIPSCSGGLNALNWTTGSGFGCATFSAGGVTSFNTRTGAVVPASGDYAVAQVTGAAPIASPTLTGTVTATGALDLTGLGTGTQVSCLGLTSGNAVVPSSGACGTGGGGSVSITAADGSIVVSPSPLTGTGTLTAGLIPVSKGGTNATSAGATAANNIGALAEANNLSDIASNMTARINLGLGTAATQNTGTSGANVPLLSTANTWTLAQTDTVLPIWPSQASNLVWSAPNGSAGLPAFHQLACNSLSNGAPSCSTDTTNASNITSGTLAAARGGSAVNLQTFSTGGTWTKPAGVTILDVCGAGGGAGGGGGTSSAGSAGGAGGGAGWYNCVRIPASAAGATVTVTIGTGGTAGTAGNAGGTGGETSFGTLLTWFGGNGGGAGNTAGATGGLGGGAFGAGAMGGGTYSSCDGSANVTSQLGPGSGASSAALSAGINGRASGCRATGGAGGSGGVISTGGGSGGETLAGLGGAGGADSLTSPGNGQPGTSGLSTCLPGSSGGGGGASTAAVTAGNGGAGGAMGGGGGGAGSTLALGTGGSGGAGGAGGLCVYAW